MTAPRCIATVKVRDRYHRARETYHQCRNRAVRGLYCKRHAQNEQPSQAGQERRD